MRDEDVLVNSNDLYTIGDTIVYLSDSINKVASNMDTINGQVDNVQEQINDMKSDVSSLENEVRNFMSEMKQNLLVGNAKQSIMISQMEYDKKYGHRDDVRRRIVGLLQSVDINAVKKNTMENIGEETVVNNPDYWLAPALVALCYWYTDNKKMAQAALKKALDRSDEKTSFLFCLVHLRASRKKTAIKWLNRYLSLQDPTNMDSKIILILDALCSGVFDKEIIDILLEKINSWCLQLKAYNEYEYLQISRWEKYFQNKDINETVVPDYIDKYVVEKDKVNNILHYSYFHNHMMDEIRSIVDNNNFDNSNHLDKIDRILNMLVFDYEDEELKLKSEIIRSNSIINSVDNNKSNNYLNNKLLYYSKNDFYTHISNIGLNEDLLDISLNTRKMAIAFSKEYIIEAYKRVTNVNSQSELIELTIVIDDWYGNTKDGSNEGELKQDLDKHITAKYADYIYKSKFVSKEMIISIIVGLFAIVFAYKSWILLILIISMLFLYNGMILLNNNKMKKIKTEEMIEEKRLKQEILINTICEIVDYYFVYSDSKKQHDEFISYINSLNYNDYIKASIVNKRKNIIIGGKR